MDKLLRCLAERSPTLGGAVKLDPAIDWPLAYSRDEPEFTAVQGELVSAGWIKGGPDGIRLTPAGWERFERLEAQSPALTAAFVAMWFDEQMNKAYEAAIEPTLRDLGYDPIRVDKKHQRDKIDDYIMASIRKSALLVADFTGMRSGVFFEAGFALGLNKPVVWTCRKTWRDRDGNELTSAEIREHFDTRQYPHILWTDAADLRIKLSERIEALGLSKPRSER
jgi:nucleoside 2-deoxyribosyltransferase